MLKTLKKNPALSIGLVIPLLMLLLFGGIPFISSFFVEAPKYNLIYSIKSYQTDGKIRLNNGRLELDAYNKTSSPNEPPALYLIDVHSKKSTKLNYVLNKGENLLIPANQTRTYIIEELSMKGLDTSTTSPDGYQFISDNSDNLYFFPFFFGGNRQNFISLRKSGRIERFQTVTDGYWGAKFEAWVLP